MGDLKTLQNAAKSFTVLYAEDNEALRVNAAKLFKNLFKTVYVASDGQEALDIFRREKVDIVISDIKMPRMNGFELIEKIRYIKPSTKFIIMSAFDEKEYLLRAIEDGISAFLKKPVSVVQLTETLLKAVEAIESEQNKELFFMHLKSIFNYQSSMVMMLYKRKIVLANQVLLDFFDVENTLEFIEYYKDIGAEFLPHESFLYNRGEIDWFDVVELNEKKLFHVKMLDNDDKTRHFILKYQSIPQKDDYGIVSFDDVTELNLLRLFDEKQSKSDVEVHDTKALYDLLEVLQRNSAEIEVHNYYKGLSITNNALISEIKDESISIKTTFLQLKAMQFEQRTILSSEALPSDLACESIVKMSFEKQTAELQGLHFVNTSAVKRKTIRIVPDEKHTVSLFIREGKFHGDITIEDLSLDAIKLKLNALPAGLEKGTEVTLDIVLELDKRPLIINTKAVMFRKSESKHSFSVVFMFAAMKKSELTKYITKRQMAIIREFKGLQNG